MKIVENEKGITILSLIIIVVLLLIIAGVAASFSGFNVNSSIDAKYEGELRMVQYAVFQQYAKYKLTKDNSNLINTRDFSNEILAFKSANYAGISLGHIPSNDDEAYQKYYYINPSDLKKLGIQDSNYAYIINYYTGEVMNADIFKTNANRALYLDGRESTADSPSY